MSKSLEENSVLMEALIERFKVAVKDLSMVRFEALIIYVECSWKPRHLIFPLYI